MKKALVAALVVPFALLAVASVAPLVAQAPAATTPAEMPPPPPPPISPRAAAAAYSNADPVGRGEFLVRQGACNDCHTPLKMGPNGPEPDNSRLLSGHPQDLVMPTPLALAPDAPWNVLFSASGTAISGPWGVSFTRNLTSDVETGLGGWTADEFVATIKSGRRQGRGRYLLPPMPWPQYAGLSEDDLKSIFAYLKSLPAIKNKVPDPLPPPAPPAAAK